MYRSSTSSVLAKALVCLASHTAPLASTRPSTVQRPPGVFRTVQAPADFDDVFVGELLKPLAVEGLGPRAEHHCQFLREIRRCRLSALFQPQLVNTLATAREEDIRVAAANAAAAPSFLRRGQLKVLKPRPLHRICGGERLWRRVGQQRVDLVQACPLGSLMIRLPNRSIMVSSTHARLPTTCSESRPDFQDVGLFVDRRGQSRRASSIAPSSVGRPALEQDFEAFGRSLADLLAAEAPVLLHPSPC